MTYFHSSLVIALSSNLRRGAQDDWASYAGNWRFQHAACCIKKSMRGFWTLMKVMNSFAPSQEGDVLPLRDPGPTANCQWAVKVNTCSLSLQTAHSRLLATSGCFTLMWTVRLSILGPKWTKVHIHLIGACLFCPPPLFLVGKIYVRSCFLTPRKLDIPT